MRRLHVLAVTLAVLPLAGCGASSSANKFKGEERKVADKVEDLETAARQHKEDDLCNKVVTKDLATRLGGGNAVNCSPAVKKLFDKDVDDANLTVDSVKITGTTAAVVIKEQRKNKDVKVPGVTLQKVGTDWRISALPQPAS